MEASWAIAEIWIRISLETDALGVHKSVENPVLQLNFSFK
jgi:hypothetical protein